MTPFDLAVAAVRDGQAPEEAAKSLYGQLTTDERLGLLDGDTEFWAGMRELMQVGYNIRPIRHGAVERFGIPGTCFVDGPRGCVAGQGTAFPVSMARGATWDVDLEERVGGAIGREIRAQGGNFFGGVCVNLPRHPAWGRAQETYGDEPYHLGEFGAALIRGAQKYVMACAKHYALNSMENARFKVDVTIDEASLHDIYLPHFKRCVDEGVAAIMSAYNSVNGAWAGQNKYLLTDVLRNQWGWRGITVSDFIWGLRDAAASLNAGLDLEEPFAQQRAMRLRGQIESGETGWDMVERSGVRLIAAQLRSYAARESGAVPAGVMACDEHRALAREVAARAMVLLKNAPVDGRPVLPLDPAAIDSIAVIGRLANAANMGDLGSSNVRAPGKVTPVDGIRAAFPGAKIILAEDEDLQAAAVAATRAQVAIVVAGFTERDEGEYVGTDTLRDPILRATFPPAPPEIAKMLEAGGAPGNVMVEDGYGGDRASLTMRPEDEELIRAIAKANPRTVVVLVAAGAVITESWRHEVPAIVMMWYAGMEGGHALADVLIGRHNPSGRLPFSVPTSADHLPFFERDATTITYDRFHGQRLLDRLGVDAAYPHGFGLSYTTFEIADAKITSHDDLTVRVRVTNTGARAGRHVIQVYGCRTEGEHAAENYLVGFMPVEVPAGESVNAEAPVSLAPLAVWNPELKKRERPANTTVELRVGAHAKDPAACRLVVAV
ncbi:MAG: glycoside hydrolase family 3 C-terminal domain-containing protein [Vicinamibacteria bacterium]|nr:glycoside hydrolase family 3 C-terminal domain-containing protein [Vicinamibacteria bacterium]